MTGTDREQNTDERTCATCRWWRDITSQYDELAEWQWDDHPKIGIYPDRERMPGRWGECGKVDELEPSGKESQFYVTDGSDYRATLHTRETFGCNQWEAPA